MTTRANIYIDQGIDFSTYLDLFTDQGGDIDISNYSFAGDAKKVYSSSKIFSFNTSLAVGEVNRLTISLSANTSANIEPGKYQYDVVMQSPTEGRVKILEGIVFILPTMTSMG